MHLQGRFNKRRQNMAEAKKPVGLLKTVLLDKQAVLKKKLTKTLQEAEQEEEKLRLVNQKADHVSFLCRLLDDL